MKVIHLPQQEVETKDNEEQKEGSKTSRELPTCPTHLLRGHQKEQILPQMFTTADFLDDINKNKFFSRKCLVSSPQVFATAWAQQKTSTRKNLLRVHICISFLNFSLQVFIFLQQLIYAIQALKVIN